MALIQILISLITMVLLPVAFCDGPGPLQTFNYKRESYSTYGQQIANRHLVLDLYPLRSYTHYFSTSDFMRSYNFTVHVRRTAKTQNTTIGMFITKAEFGEEITVDVKVHRVPRDASNATRKTKVCSRYTIKLSYPEDSGKSAKYLCDQHGEEANITELLELENYEGPGVVFVEISNRFLLRPIFKNVNFTSDYAVDPFDTHPWKNDNGRSIPSSSIGSITFTLYQDCSESTDVLKLTPCSMLHNTTCIPSALFCNADPNCVSTVWDYIFHPKVNLNTTWVSSQEEVEQDLVPTYDESNGTCGDASHRMWKRTTITRTFTYSNTGGGSSSGSLQGYWILGVMIFLISAACGWLAKNKGRAGTGNNEPNEEEEDAPNFRRQSQSVAMKHRNSEQHIPLRTQRV